MGTAETTPELTPAQAMCLPDFDLKRYTGRWFEMQREVNTPFEKGDFVTADYNFTDAHEGVQVVNTEQRADKAEPKQVIGRAIM